MRVAIVGGTGTFGQALALRLGAGGIDVLIGSRDAGRAGQIAAVVGAGGWGTNTDVVGDADLAVLAVRSAAALDTARDLSAPLGSTPLLSVAADLRFEEGGVFPGRLGRSLAEEIADVVQGPVVAGFQSLAAANIMQSKPDQDALVCGDDADSKQLALECGGHLVAGRTVDVGPLAVARALEGLTALLLNVNRRFKVQAGVRLTGLP